MKLLGNINMFIKKHILVTSIIVLLIIAIVVVSLLLFNKPKTNIELYDDLNLEINSEVYLLSLIKRVDNGELLTENIRVDTSTLGEQQINIKYINEFGNEEEYNFEVNIVDTTKPIIEFESELSTTIGNEINLLERVQVSDNSLEELSVNVSGDYNFNVVGTYNLKYVVTDSSGNTTEEEFILKVNNATIKYNGYYAHSSSTLSGSYQFKNDGTFRFVYQYCDFGVACGGDYQTGIYEIKGNKILATTTTIYDEMGEPLSYHYEFEFVIINENKITTNGNEFNYRTELY